MIVKSIPGAEARSKRMQAMIDKYTNHFPSSSKDTNALVDNLAVVVIAGSTGSLGSYLLHLLLARPEVSKIYCLNRSQDAEMRQRESNAARGLSSDWTTEQAEFFQVDLSQPRFNMEVDSYERLREQATYFIHSQWPVDFISPLGVFEKHIQGVRNTIDFSNESENRPHILFVSSIGSVAYWSKLHPDRLVPEELIHDLGIAELGYGESKLISEIVLEKAGKASGTPSTILRIGNIAGPVNRNGLWNKNEWIPATIASSKYLGLIPSDLSYMDSIDWMPVDIVSDIMCDLIFTTPQNTPLNEAPHLTSVYHIVNPMPRPWITVVPTINQYLAAGKFKAVGFEEWVHELLDSASEGASYSANPALKLVDFYEVIMEAARSGDRAATLDTTKMSERSPAMAEFKGIGSGHVEKWLAEWRF